MVGCVLSQLKPSELYIAVEKAQDSAFNTAANVELLEHCPIHSKTKLYFGFLWRLHTYKLGYLLMCQVDEVHLFSPMRYMLWD